MDKANINEFFSKYKLPLALSLVGIVLILGGIFTSSLNEQAPSFGSKTKQDFPKESIIDSQKLISVDVSGAVLNPGVYKLVNGSRIEEAIISAGGFKEEANKEYISKYLNMAQKLTDGSKVYVPYEGETGVAPQSGGVISGVQSKININTASQSEFESLPGIGPVTASKIISDRPYQKIEELLGKKIVNKSTFEKIKNLIVVY